MICVKETKLIHHNSFKKKKKESCYFSFIPTAFQLGVTITCSQRGLLPYVYAFLTVRHRNTLPSTTRPDLWSNKKSLMEITLPDPTWRRLQNLVFSSFQRRSTPFHYFTLLDKRDIQPPVISYKTLPEGEKKNLFP